MKCCAFLVVLGSLAASAYQPNSIWNNRYDSTYNNNNAELFSNPGYNGNPSSRLFWDKFGYNTNWSGSNQVGGSWWQQLANKIPLFNSRMEYPGSYPTYNYQQTPYRPNVYSAVYPGGYQPSVYPQQPAYNGYYPGGADVVGDSVSVSAPGFSGYSYPKPQYRNFDKRETDDLKA